MTIEQSNTKLPSNKIWVSDPKEGFIEAEIIADTSLADDLLRIKLPNGTVSTNVSIHSYIQFP